MAIMEVLKSQTMSFKSGHVVRFVARTPTFVPPSAVNEALRAGAAIVDPDKDSPKLTDNAKEADRLAKAVYDAVVLTQRKNDPTEFNAHNQPRVDVINSMISPLTAKAADISAATAKIRQEKEDAHTDELNAKAQALADADAKAKADDE